MFCYHCSLQNSVKAYNFKKGLKLFFKTVTSSSVFFQSYIQTFPIFLNEFFMTRHNKTKKQQFLSTIIFCYLQIKHCSSTGNFKLPEPFQFFYFFKQKLCSRIEGMQGNIATGTLLRPANTEMALGRESIVENFTIVGPIKCRNRKRSTWYAFLSPRYLNLDVNSLIIKQTGDLISVPKSMSTALDGYVQTLL